MYELWLWGRSTSHEQIIHQFTILDRTFTHFLKYLILLISIDGHELINHRHDVLDPAVWVEHEFEVKKLEELYNPENITESELDIEAIIKTYTSAWPCSSSCWLVFGFRCSQNQFILWSFFPKALQLILHKFQSQQLLWPIKLFGPPQLVVHHMPQLVTIANVSKMLLEPNLCWFCVHWSVVLP